jgi:hypothetical protein
VHAVSIPCRATQSSHKAWAALGPELLMVMHCQVIHTSEKASRRSHICSIMQLSMFLTL